MGNVVNLSIHMDYFHLIEKDPQSFVENLFSAINSNGGKIPGAVVQPYLHTTDFQLYASCGRLLPLDQFDDSYNTFKGNAPEKLKEIIERAEERITELKKLL